MSRFCHIILDRDGVLNQEGATGFVERPEQWIWLPGTVKALARLSRAGFRLSVVTNQSCVGRGIIESQVLDRIHDLMRYEASKEGVQINAVYCCIHAPIAGCECRKPKAALVHRAIYEAGIAPSKTVMVGDSASDLQAAHAAGIEAWLVRTGKGRSTEAELLGRCLSGLSVDTIRIFDDLNSVCDAILDSEHGLAVSASSHTATIPVNLPIITTTFAEHRAVFDRSLPIIESRFEAALELCKGAFRSGGKLLVCGNGGSAADAQLFAVELIGRLEDSREGLSAIDLTTDTSCLAAISNEFGFEWVFARQVTSLGRLGDILIVMSTISNSINVLRAIEAARSHRLRVIALTGQHLTSINKAADVVIPVPSTSAARIQEIQAIFLHALAAAVDGKFSNGSANESSVTSPWFLEKSVDDLDPGP